MSLTALPDDPRALRTLIDDFSGPLAAPHAGVDLIALLVDPDPEFENAI